MLPPRLFFALKLKRPVLPMQNFPTQTFFYRDFSSFDLVDPARFHFPQVTRHEIGNRVGTRLVFNGAVSQPS